MLCGNVSSHSTLCNLSLYWYGGLKFRLLEAPCGKGAATCNYECYAYLCRLAGSVQLAMLLLLVAG